MQVILVVLLLAGFAWFFKHQTITQTRYSLVPKLTEQETYEFSFYEDPSISA